MSKDWHTQTPKPKRWGEPTDEEIAEELRREGIDMKPAFERLRKIINKAKAERN